MLPTQILLNNFLYDVAQVTIPTDNVDDAYVRAPQHWNIGLIHNCMIFIGPISSIYDFLTFFCASPLSACRTVRVPYRMVCGILGHANPGFVRHPLRSRPSKALTQPLWPLF